MILHSPYQLLQDLQGKGVVLLNKKLIEDLKKAGATESEIRTQVLEKVSLP